MKIYVDADAFPNAVKDILLRASSRLKVEIVFVANKSIYLPESEYLSMVIVESGPDIADDRIVELVASGNLVITEDIPLADRVISKGGTVITPRGDLLTENNIKEKLAVRNLFDDLRNGGMETGGPGQFNQKTVSSFANQLDRFLTRNS